MIAIAEIGAAARQAALLEGCLWLGAVVGVVGVAMLLGIYWMKIRRRTEIRCDGMTVESLRRLRDQGKLSCHEYESIRTMLIGTHGDP